MNPKLGLRFFPGSDSTGAASGSAFCETIVSFLDFFIARETIKTRIRKFPDQSRTPTDDCQNKLNQIRCLV